MLDELEIYFPEIEKRATEWLKQVSSYMRDGTEGSYGHWRKRYWGLSWLFTQKTFDKHEQEVKEIKDGKRRSYKQ
jgi:hypothetical protein